MNIVSGKIFVSFLFMISWIFLHTSEVESTIAKQKKEKKPRAKPRPEGIAADNKKYPNKCHVCRVMVDEINKSLKGDKPELTEEQKKKKKREERRKSKKDRKREKAIPILLAIEDVCNQMLEYIPQEEDRKKFRYIKKKDLSDTKSLIVTQKENEDAANVLTDSYDRFYHPETNRLMSMCDEILNTYENDLVKWNSQEDKQDLLDFLCRERVLNATMSDECLDEESIKASLWTKAFDAVFEKHPELKNTEF